MNVESMVNIINKNTMDRRTFLQRFAFPALFAGAIPGILSCSGCMREYTDNPDLPNIIFITSDNLGWEDLSCYGNKNISTPNIDRIAREGIRFTNAFVVSSSCSPSRASFITGQYPHTHGVVALTHLYKTKALSPLHETLPGLLRKAGYNTAIQGKWHVSPYLPTSWYGYNERLSGIFPEDFHIRDVGKAIEFIKRNREHRFYLELNFINSHRDVHGEYHFDPEFPVNPDSIAVPTYMALPDWPEIRLDLAKYYSQNQRMDVLIGELMAALEHLQLADNTMVIFVSDNGPHYPGSIMTLYDRGTATPLIIRWPKRLPSGGTISHLINTIDLMPTILEATGIPIPQAVQGKSFLPLMTGKRRSPIHEAIFTEMDYHVLYIPTRAVRTERWKYIKNYSDNAFGLDQNSHHAWARRLCELPNHPWKRPRVPEEFYDVHSDPQEQRNLADDSRYQEQLRHLREILRRHMVKTDDPYLNKSFSHDYDPEQYRHKGKKKYW